MALINYPVSFDGYTLTNIPGVSVLATNPYAPAGRSVNLGELARSNSRKVRSAFFTKRQIKIVVAVKGASRANMENSLDLLMAKLTGIEKQLILAQSLAGAGVPSNRLYYATLSDSVPREDGGSFMYIDLIFECSDSFGYEVTNTTLLNIGSITTATRNDAFTFGGSAPWQVPIITVTYAALTGGTGKQLIIGNPAIGQQVMITRDWTTADQVIVNSYDKTVKVNGVEVDFTGAIPEWQPGAGNWTYSDNLTTRSFGVNLVYAKRYV